MLTQLSFLQMWGTALEGTLPPMLSTLTDLVVGWR